MNIVTANLLEAAISNSIKDKEMEDEKMRRYKDHDELLTLQEVMTCQCLLPPKFLSVVREDRLVELFDVFDLDNSGTVDLEEFVDSIMLLAFDGVSVTDLRVLRLLTHLRIV